MKAFVFPGQGSQFIGMGKDLAESFKDARETFEEVNDALGKDLFKLMTESPSFLRTFLEMNSQNSLYLGNTIRDQVKTTIRENLMRYFKREAMKGDGSSFVLQISKTELAGRMGVQRTSISREIAKMEQEGLLLCKGKMITLL